MQRNTKLKWTRLEARLTQDQLAERAGVSQAVISRLERGLIDRPAWITISSICAALDVEAAEVFPQGGRT